MKKSFLLLFLIWLAPFLINKSYAQVPNWLWAKSAGGINADGGNSVTIDALGNTYETGYFSSATITFGSYVLTNDSAGTADIFLVKYDASGNVLWAKRAGGTLDDSGFSLALDASGNVYMTGFFQSPNITFGSFTLMNESAGTSDIFLAKYDANGDVIWAKSAGGTSSDESEHVVVDASGNAFITGFFWSPTITFGSFTLTNIGISDVFLAKYDASGNVLWAKNAGGTSFDYGFSVALDAFGNAYVTGYFQSPTITFGSFTLLNVGSSDIFLAKYDANGNVIWAKSAGGIDGEGGNYAVVDASGNVYVTGWFYSPTIIFGTDTLTNIGWADIFLVKYDASGNVLWATSAGGTDNDFAYSVALDASGNAYVTGDYYSSTIKFDSITLTNSNTNYTEIFLAKFDTNGNVLWATSVGGTKNDAAVSVALDTSGNACLTGYFYSPTLTFGSYTLTNPGGSDIFLAKIGSGDNQGINESKNTSNICIYPNPATDEIVIKTSGISQSGSLSILNLNGQQLLQQEITTPNTPIDISSLPNGVYVVKLVGEKGVQVAKVIKR